jgi:DNA-binding response OmpR family regulator
MPHILIIEPDRLLGGNINDYFKSAGYLVAVHGNPQAALTAADQQKPDVIIAEMQLAGRSGVEFLYEFRSYPDWQAVPIIIYTNLNADQTARYADSLDELSVSAVLYKTQAGLAGLLQTVERFAPAHAKV